MIKVSYFILLVLVLGSISAQIVMMGPGYAGAFTPFGGGGGGGFGSDDDDGGYGFGFGGGDGYGGGGGSVDGESILMIILFFYNLFF